MAQKNDEKNPSGLPDGHGLAKSSVGLSYRLVKLGIYSLVAFVGVFLIVWAFAGLKEWSNKKSIEAADAVSSTTTSSDTNPFIVADQNVQADAISPGIVANDPSPPADPPTVPDEFTEITLSDANSKTIWSTSVYSYAGNNGGPGGGLANDTLEVGGWGDTYVSLLKFDVIAQRNPRKVVLVLWTKADAHAGSSTTNMSVHTIRQDWSWVPGDRLWWRDLPSTNEEYEVVAPGQPETEYELDITPIYNAWVNGTPNYGIMLVPKNTNDNFNRFYSPRADASRQPRLRLYY